MTIAPRRITQPALVKMGLSGHCPVDDGIDKVSLGLRFTSHLPAHAMIPPGHWELFKMAVELAQSGALTPLNEKEQEIVRAIAMDSKPIFTKQA